jgi:hypothetical protein
MAPSVFDREGDDEDTDQSREAHADGDEKKE